MVNSQEVHSKAWKTHPSINFEQVEQIARHERSKATYELLGSIKTSLFSKAEHNADKDSNSESRTTH